jgi:dephospho-CoA kinase
VKRWGPVILAPTGELDRTRIADRVFANSETGRADREFWDKVTHRRIRERITAQIDELRRNAGSIVILEAALLLEAGWNEICDAIVYVDAPQQLRQQRALGRGWTVTDFERREAVQWNPSEKRKLSDFVIDNTGTRKQIYDQVLDVWRVLSGDVGPCPPMVNPPKGLQ